MLRPELPIVTERLVLRGLRADDVDALHDFERRPDVTAYIPWGPRSRDDVAETLTWRAGRTSIQEEGDALLLGIALHDGALIGHIMLRWVSAEHSQGEIGFVLHPDHQRRGYGSEAATRVLQLGFEEMGLHRIVGICDARNAASAGLMAGLGMRLEAHLRENEMFKGEWSDELDYAMLDREWYTRAGQSEPTGSDAGVT